MRNFVMALFVLGVLPLLSLAEEQDVGRGERVRVETTAGDRLTGRVAESSSEGMVIELEDDGGSRSIPVQSVASIETEAPRSRSRGAWSKAKWGALIGAVSGTTLGFQHEQVGEDGASVAEAVALGVWSGGIMGGLIGAVIGAVNPGEEWVKVDPRAQLGGRDPGFSISVTLEF
jgi:hypothetical protein